MCELVRKHKELNREPMKFDKEIYLNWFNEIILKFNKEIDITKEVVFNYTEIKNKLKLQNNQTFEKFLKDFNDKSSGIFEVPNEKGVKLVGSIFSFKIDENNQTVGVRVNGYFQDFIFSKLDIDTMKKFKKGSRKKVSEGEREYHHINKKKYEQLFLEDNEVLKSLRGKYNKRIYQLLIQFKNTGHFWMKWSQFIEVLEIPKTYKTGSIDIKILKPLKKELIKANLEITEIEKKKKGRSIDTIHIYFKTSPKLLQGIDTSNEKIKQPTKEMRSSLQDEKIKLHTMLGKTGNFKLMDELNEIDSIEKLLEFKEKNKISNRNNILGW